MRQWIVPRAISLAVVAIGVYVLASQTDPSSAAPSDESALVLVMDSHTATATATTTSQDKARRSITLETARSRVRAGSRGVLTGRLKSPEPECVQNEFVKIKRRSFGSNSFRYLVSGLTDFKGLYRFDVKVRRNATYMAITTGTEACKRAESTPREILAKVRVVAQASGNPVPQGTYFRIEVSVHPGHPHTDVLLQVKRASGFVTVDRSALGGRSRMDFILVAGWEGTRTYRVKWPKQDRDHVDGFSRPLRIATT